MKSEKQKEFLHQLSENQGIIHKICRIYTDNIHDHEDLFQEIVIQTWKSYSNYRGDAKFSTWIYKIGLNTALALFKKKNHKKEELHENLTHFKIYDDNSHEEKDAQIQAMYNAIHLLSDVEKALIMMFLEDKPYKEISEILGITEGNARVKMNRAKEKLRNLIKK